MDWSSVLNAILIPALAGLGGLIVWLVKFYIPKVEERKDKELEAKLKAQETELQAKLEDSKDTREHSQEQESVAIDILRDLVKSSSEEVTELRNAIYRLGRQTDNNTQSVRALASVVEEYVKRD